MSTEATKLTNNAVGQRVPYAVGTEAVKLPNNAVGNETKKALAPAQQSTETTVELDVSSLFQRLTDLEKENAQLRQYLEKAYNERAWDDHYATDRTRDLEDENARLEAENEQLRTKLAKARKALVETASPPDSPAGGSWYQGPLPITAEPTA